MIFEDHLIKQGEVGGREAAGILWAAIRDLAHQRIPDLSSDVKIMTRIYANLKGLGDVCHRAGILDKPSAIEDFARGFTGSKQLFDFVDVGSGKDRADDKLSGRCPLRSLDRYSLAPTAYSSQRYSNFISMTAIVAILSLGVPMTMDTLDCWKRHKLIGLCWNALRCLKVCRSRKNLQASSHNIKPRKLNHCSGLRKSMSTNSRIISSRHRRKRCPCRISLHISPGPRALRQPQRQILP